MLTDKIIKYKFLPSGVIATIDSILIILGFILSELILNVSVELVPLAFKDLVIKLVFVLGTSLTFLLLLKVNQQIIRFTMGLDIVYIGLSFFLASLATFAIAFFYTEFSRPLFVKREILLIYIVCFALLVFFRTIVRELFAYSNHVSSNKINQHKKRIYVVGCSLQSISLAEALTTDNNYQFTVDGFISSSVSRKNKVYGKKVISSETFIKILEDTSKEKPYGIAFTSSIIKAKYDNLVNQALKHKLKVFITPSIEEKDKKPEKNKIKQINIEDLLNRPAIQIENSEVSKYVYKKIILITGAAGSIGSEICRQLARLNPKKLIIVDFAESPLYNLENELIQLNDSIEVSSVLIDIRKSNFVDEMFHENKIDVVYHAAALKHVPLMEKFPKQSILTNVLGTINIAQASLENEVSKFVFVSTDKAVNPTNVMGATKRASEIYLKYLNEKKPSTKFVVTRFGNVLGSNGSVVPHFEKQIAAGGPVTVTHRDIIRYFMTIPEACQLVLQAGAMASGGEIFIFDMGKLVKIFDLAKRMIWLSGLEPNVDIQIKITGLRPGEKLYEELLTNETINLATYHPKIKVLKELGFVFPDKIDDYFSEIVKVEKYTDEELVKLLKKIVPEYKSKNSIYEKLDLS